MTPRPTRAVHVGPSGYAAAVRGPRPRLKGEAISVHIEQKESWANVLRSLRDKVGPEADGINMVRKTASGNLLIEFGRKADPTKFFEKIDGTLGEGVRARRLQQRLDLEVRDIERLTTAAQDIQPVTDSAEGGLLIRDIRCKVLREGPRATMVAVVEVPAPCADKILKKGRIKIGWVNCRARLSPRLTRCFGCHDIGHIARQCPLGISEQEKMCRRCGSKGHSMQDCTEDMNCRLCAARGVTGALAAHIAASARCPIYREEAARSLALQSKRYGGARGP